MVLQRAPVEAVIWGYAVEVGDEVSVDLDGKTTVTNAFQGEFGSVIWQLHLQPMPEGGPYVILATSREFAITLSDVLFGDVWMCSGQGNMEFALKSVIDDAESEIEDVVNYPDVRTMMAEPLHLDDPVEDLVSIEKEWGRPTTDTIGDFSALCWLYGRNLNRKYNRPMGMIQSVLLWLFHCGMDVSGSF
ncbi:hypothetical protein CAPTEDRAFT_211890 [Capitella teleta]|uniref:Uncharacterized protein n=1 Tax=Capitella teleta TaxID=283909 RepID=R7TZI9_CAPTE|nr:hypothetical protein CAPTEDRAFT_211890 [Capitella teleta]|eukprot:ELT99363.1 hypothetical protein CAPTEDRAFT_211890 [Capitella teleta]